MSSPGSDSSASGVIGSRPCSSASAGAPLVVEVGAGDDLERVEGNGVRHVHAADDAAADNTDTGGGVHASARRPRPARVFRSFRKPERMLDSGEGRSFGLVLLDDQPFDAGAPGRLREPAVVDRPLAERDEDRPIVPAHVLDMDERGARACSLEQRNRVGAGIPDPAEIELEEKRRAVQRAAGDRGASARRRATPARRHGCGIRAVARAGPRAAASRRSLSQTASASAAGAGWLDPAHDEPIRSERNELGEQVVRALRRPGRGPHAGRRPRGPCRSRSARTACGSRPCRS